MLVVKRGGKQSPHTVNVGGVELTLVRYEVEGRVVLGAEVPDDHPRVRDIARSLKTLPHLYELHGAPKERAFDAKSIRPLDPVQPPAPTPAPSSTAPARSVGDVIRVAVGNGWQEVDLKETGASDAGPRGGTSPVTGLTLAQMALTSPPPGWAEQRATRYPWECDGFVPPGIGPGGAPWVPPRVPDKVPRPPAEDPPPVVEDPPADEAGTKTPAEGTGVDPDPKPKKTPKPKASDADPALEAGLEAEAIAILRPLVHELTAAIGKAPHVNKVRHAVQKINAEAPKGAFVLPAVNQKQIEALLARKP